MLQGIDKDVYWSIVQKIKTLKASSIFPTRQMTKQIMVIHTIKYHAIKTNKAMSILTVIKWKKVIEHLYCTIYLQLYIFNYSIYIFYKHLLCAKYCIGSGYIEMSKINKVHVPTGLVLGRKTDNTFLKLICKVMINAGKTIKQDKLILLTLSQ